MMKVSQITLVQVFVLFLATALPLQAQDCGNECHECGTNGHEGRAYHPNGDYNMTCQVTETGSCDECNERAASDSSIEALTIAGAVDAVSPTELAAVVEAYGDRLLISVDRRIAVVQGNGCNSEALAIVVHLSTAKTRALQRLGVRSLQEFLARDTAQSP